MDISAFIMGILITSLPSGSTNFPSPVLVAPILNNSFSSSVVNWGFKVTWNQANKPEFFLQRSSFGSLICESVTYSLHRAPLLVSVYMDNSHFCQE
jgi:hypothetical protein